MNTGDDDDFQRIEEQEPEAPVFQRACHSTTHSKCEGCRQADAITHGQKCLKHRPHWMEDEGIKNNALPLSVDAHWKIALMVLAGQTIDSEEREFYEVLWYGIHGVKT